MRVRVIEERCQGHTLCFSAAPQLIQLRDEDGHATVTTTDVPPELEAAARRAAVGCPEQAIELHE